MAQLPAARSRTQLRARRWDAVVLGSALPGLVAAARLGLAGKRVLVVEEETSARRFPPTREPFLLTGGAGAGVVSHVLKELRIPLIDLRRIEPDPLAYQVVLPDARVDVGSAAHTTEELVAWGLAKPDVAQPILRALGRAAAAENDAILAAPVVRTGGLRRRGRSAPPPTRHARGMPAEASDLPEELVPFFETQVRALSGLATADPGPEARARLLGAALDGGAAFPTSEHGLHALVRERIRSLHGEFRPLSTAFGLVSADGEPGVAPARSVDLWLGRTLIVNAPRGLLARMLGDHDFPIPEFLAGPPPPRRRATLHLRARADLIPEGMARRVVCLRDPSAPPDGTNVVRVAVYPLSGGSDVVDLVASAVVEAEDPDRAARLAEIQASVTGLLPFSEGRLGAQEVAVPRWDDDDALEDPETGAAWPAEIEIRALSRPPVYVLPRAALAGLGVEGDLLLGWRAGDRIAADLR